MTKQPTRGHISLRGTTYAAFKDACYSSNLSMGKVLSALITDELDRIESFSMTLEANREIDQPTNVTSPEELLALFHHTFSPKPQTQVLDMSEVRSQEPTDLDEDFFIPQREPRDYPKGSPYHVEVTPKSHGLFSEAGLRAAKTESRVAHAPRKAEGTKPVPNADDLPSCIDPSWSKK